MKKKILAVAVIATFLIGSLSFAKEQEPTSKDPVAVIDAEDIGIATVPIQIIEETEVPEDTIEEPEEVIEESKEPVQEEIVYEIPEAPADQKEPEQQEQEEDVVEKECDVCDKCDSCPDDKHDYAHVVTIDDEETYIYEEWCNICGHGGDKEITQEEFEELGVDTYIEF